MADGRFSDVITTPKIVFIHKRWKLGRDWAGERRKTICPSVKCHNIATAPEKY